MKRTLAILIAATTLVATMAPAALAQTDTTEIDRLEQRANDLGNSLERVKEAAAAAIEQRFDTLDRLTEHVESYEHLTDSHAASLLADYESTRAGLTALGADIEATDNLADALELSLKIAVDYRVYLVVAPKSVEVAVSDTIVAAVSRIEEAGAEIQDVIDTMEGAGFDVTEAQQFLDNALANADQAEVLGGPVADQVIGLTASDWQNPAEATLLAGKADLEQGRERVRAAVEGIHDTLKALRQSRG